MKDIQLKQDLRAYIKELENKINYFDQKATEAEGTTAYAAHSTAAFELRMVRYDIHKLLLKHEQQNRLAIGTNMAGTRRTE